LKLTRWFSSVASSVKTASSSKMLSTSSGHGRLVSGDNGTVGMAHQVDVQVEGASVAVGGHWGDGGHWGGVGDGRNSSVGNVSSSVVTATGSKVVGTGGSNCRLVGRDDGTVGVAYQGGVQVEGSSVAVGNNGSSVGNHRGSVGNSNRGSVGNGNRGSVATASGKVVSTSCSNGRLVNGNNSSIGMANKGGVQVEGSGIAVGNNWSSGMGNGRGSMGNGRSNAMGGGKCSEVFSTGCGHCRLVNWNHCPIGVTHQAVEAGGSRGKSQGN